MKRGFIVFALALLTIILLSPCTPQAASSTTSASAKAKPKATAITVALPQTGGIYKVVIRSRSNAFGYPPRVTGSNKDYAPPFFDHLLSIGNDGKYKPELALDWDISKDGKTVTFKLRQGVTFHDGTPFNAHAVKANIDNLIPPNANILSGVTSVDVIDEYTVKFNLPSYNNLILFHLAVNPATWMYSPDALKKNGVDWAMTHPVGTGPFMLKDHQPNISLILIRNPNYWQKGLPYLDGIEMAMVPEPMTQILTFKSGQAHAIYSIQEAAAQLRDEGYHLLLAPGAIWVMNFDTKNSPIFSNPKVRQAIEYAIDKEAICSGPGQGLYGPMYQVVPSDHPDFNKACPPRKYDPIKAKKLLIEAGYPNGFTFKMFGQDVSWKDGLVAVQSYLAAVGIMMDINYVNASVYDLIRAGGKIEKGASAYASLSTSSNTLFAFDAYWRSDSVGNYGYVVKPAGIDKLIDQAKLSRDPAAITKINRQILKLVYDDETVVPLYMNMRIAIADKSVQNTGWFIYGNPDNNQFGTRTWLKK